MFVLSKDGKRTQLANLNECPGLIITNKGIEALGNYRVVVFLNSNYDECSARLNDVIDALQNGVKVYDTTASVGAWRKESAAEKTPQKTTTRKSNAAPKQ